jgi:hypothetical protein
MTNYDELIATYEVDVSFPDVSGMEHLDMLLTRSEIARGEHDLTVEQRGRLAEADKVLLQQAGRFYQAIQRIADLDVWRRDENVPSSHWWWYLDVLARLPELPAREPLPETATA